MLKYNNDTRPSIMVKCLGDWIYVIPRLGKTPEGLLDLGFRAASDNRFCFQTTRSRRLCRRQFAAGLLIQVLLRHMAAATIGLPSRVRGGIIKPGV
jgi:hypothetical protein